MLRFLITIDTEGDDLWSKPKEITTRNAEYLPRFQGLCEAYGLKPTWLTNYEMARCPRFREFGREVLRRGTGEIGMHLHAWNNPPLVSLTADDFEAQPYLIEYPTPVMRDKIWAVTDLLEETFEVPMVSHRAGRWGLNAVYAQLLADRGYRVDCSVTPLVSWRIYRHGPDFSRFPAGAYWLDLQSIHQPGRSRLLELPVTIRTKGRLFAGSVHRATGGLSARARGVVRRLFPIRWLRPNGSNLEEMLRLVASERAAGAGYIEFILHSSEFMPGGSETFRTAGAIDRLYEHLEQLFAEATRTFTGCTLSEYYDEFHAAELVRAQRSRTHRNTLKLEEAPPCA